MGRLGVESCRPAAVLGGVLLLGAVVAACGGPAPLEPSSPATPAPAGRRIDPPSAAGSLAPNLTLAGGEVMLSWLEPLADGHHRLLVSRFDGTDWQEPSVIAEGDRFFANWADLPAVAESGDGSLVAHWLAKTAEDTYAYSILLARSLDGGESWAALGQLNKDDTPAEHGFVSYAPEGSGLRAFWLDGREMESGGAMGLRTAVIGETIGAEEVLDQRVCECCSTDAAGGEAGALVVYRDRAADETRDISVVRRRGAAWTEPEVAVADGWMIAGCPVNGPAVDSVGETAAVAWFTAAGDEMRVQFAFLEDAAGTFGSPLVIDADAPAGRVDLVLDGSGGAVVSWLGIVDEAGSVRLRRVSADGRMGEPLEIATTGAARASGFPRLQRLADTLYLAWVDTTPESGQHLRASAIPLDQLPNPL
jgi:hypothetical protein